MGMYLVLVIMIAGVVALLILMNTSILANKDIPELVRELWRTYFGKDDTLSDDEQNPSLKK
jgi:hypothetical protein